MYWNLEYDKCNNIKTDKLTNYISSSTTVADRILLFLKAWLFFFKAPWHSSLGTPFTYNKKMNSSIYISISRNKAWIFRYHWPLDISIELKLLKQVNALLPSQLDRFYPLQWGMEICSEISDGNHGTYCTATVFLVLIGVLKLEMIKMIWKIKININTRSPTFHTLGPFCLPQPNIIIYISLN